MLPEYKLIDFNATDFNSLQSALIKNEPTHTILTFSEEFKIDNHVTAYLLEISSKYKENGMSFVVVQDKIDIDIFPDTLNIVPTLQEAEDILEMEAIERDLGF